MLVMYYLFKHNFFPQVTVCFMLQAFSLSPLFLSASFSPSVFAPWHVSAILFHTANLPWMMDSV